MGPSGDSTFHSVLLEPSHPPIGLNAAFRASHVETLIMKETMRGFSGNNFGFQNSVGQDVVRCHGQGFSWRDRKESRDARQMPLFTVRNKVLAFQRHS